MTKSFPYDSLGYFSILNITPISSDEEIRQKYRDLAKFWHPDYNNSPNAIDMFKKISVAYDILKDEHLRLKYSLLSMIYETSKFPDMNALLILKNIHGQDDINIRAFPLIEITGKGLKYSSIEKIYYCSPFEASSVIEKITKHNWIYGFWGITSIIANIRAIIKNICSTNNKKENFKLFVHNALAYESEGKKNEALTLVLQAKKYASNDQLFYINKYIEYLNDYKPLSLKKWNLSKLRNIQLLYPFVCFMVVFIIFSYFNLKHIEKMKKSKINLKEVVIFKDGQKMYSDVSVAKILDIPIDLYDKTKLYHTVEVIEARHGADDSFDIYKKVEKNTTVRITGYTSDNKWLRVMFDNGEMAFIRAEYLQQGIGNSIPLWSKIFKE